MLATPSLCQKSKARYKECTCAKVHYGLMADKNVSLNSYSLTSDPPAWMLLVPAGLDVPGRDGRSFINPGPASLIDAFRSNGVDIVVDVEHSSHTQAVEGKPAPAFGWIVDLEDRSGELWGKVEWTEGGKAAVSSREYRYYSPAYSCDAAARIMRVVSVGLTNTPNLRLPALNNQGGDVMDKFKQDVAEAMGLKADAAEPDVIAKAKELAGAVSLNRQQDMVPKTDLTLALNRAQTAETELTNLKKAQFESKRDEQIDKAVADGKIAPASKDYYKTSCNSEEALAKFTEFVGTLPNIVTNGEQPRGADPTGGVELNAEQIAFAAKLGVNAEDARKFYKDYKESK